MSRSNLCNPVVSIVMAVHAAREHIARAVEILSSESSREFQLLVVDCASDDGTRELIDKFADRDIRIDIESFDSDDLRAGRLFGIERARAPYALFLDGDEWLAPGSIEHVISQARAGSADILLSNRQFDSYDARGECHSRVADYRSLVAHDRDELKALLPALIASDVLEGCSGLVVRRSLFENGGLRAASSESDCEFAVSCVCGASSVVSVPSALCHTTVSPVAGAYDPNGCVNLEGEQRSFERLACRLDAQDDPEVALALSKRHFRRLIACIENICLSPQSVSSIERNARVRDIVESEDAQKTVEALRSHGREFGFMYSSIAKKNVAACCMGAWAANLLHPVMRRSPALAGR